MKKSIQTLSLIGILILALGAGYYITTSSYSNKDLERTVQEAIETDNPDLCSRLPKYEHFLSEGITQINCYWRISIIKQNSSILCNYLNKAPDCPEGSYVADFKEVADDYYRKRQEKN